MKLEEVSQLKDYQKKRLLEEMLHYDLFTLENFDLSKILGKVVTTQDQKVAFLIALHKRLSIDAPKNSIGASLVSSYDYVAASKDVQIDAILMAFCPSKEISVDPQKQLT